VQKCRPQSQAAMRGRPRPNFRSRFCLNVFCGKLCAFLHVCTWQTVAGTATCFESIVGTFCFLLLSALSSLVDAMPRWCVGKAPYVVCKDTCVCSGNCLFALDRCELGRFDRPYKTHTRVNCSGFHSTSCATLGRLRRHAHTHISVLSIKLVTCLGMHGGRLAYALMADRCGCMPPFVSVDGYAWGTHAKEEKEEILQELKELLAENKEN